MTEEIQKDSKIHWTVKLVDRFMDSVDGFGTKILSARFLAVTLDTIIYPGCVVLCGYLTHLKVIEPETFIAVLGAYALLVKETRLKYFDRTDRIKGDINVQDSTKPSA